MSVVARVFLLRSCLSTCSHYRCGSVNGCVANAQEVIVEVVEVVEIVEVVEGVVNQNYTK